jgi:23S rRNA (pseudouridine1915-N3)-methyltransferase
MAEIPSRAYRVAMCVEGKQMCSEDFSRVLTDAAQSNGEICFIIGSSHGLSDGVKNACDLKMSVSKLTFPHQLIRVVLLEAVYRGFNIARGTKYHK